jgi:hypothetical protein
VNVYTLLWVLWAVAFAAIEGFALKAKDKPGQPHTLSAHVWWAVRGAGPWHHAARVVLALGLAWLSAHLLGP